MIYNLHTVRSAAKKLNVSTTWVYKLISKGEIDSKCIDGVTFVVYNDKFNEVNKL